MILTTRTSGRRRRPDFGMRVSLDESLDCFVLRHSHHLVFRYVKDLDQRLSHPDGDGLASCHRLYSTVRLLPVLDATPEIRISNIQLVTEDMGPQLSAVAASVCRVTHSRIEDPPVRQHELEPNVVGARLTPSIFAAVPPFDDTESFVVSAGRRREAHRSPCSQALSCSSLDNSMSCTRPQFFSWFEARRRRADHASA